jgi:hypothetical protein
MTNLKFDGNMVLIRMLSHQLTGQVVWYSIDSPSSLLAKRVPICCADLDYVNYAGPGPSSLLDFWTQFKHYKLVYSQSDAKFDTADLSAEFVDHVRLERAKCYATQLVHASAQWAAEKNGLVENPLYDAALDPNHVANIIAEHHGISKPDADKLLAFKLQEYKITLHDLRYAQIEAEMAIVSAETVSAVIDAYKIAMTSFGRLRFDEKSLTKFL